MDRQRARDPVLRRFAGRLRRAIGAQRVLLFGSRVRGADDPDSDYDFIVVSPRYAGVAPLQRGLDLWDVWRDVGGVIPST